LLSFMLLKRNEKNIPALTCGLSVRHVDVCARVCICVTFAKWFLLSVNVECGFVCVTGVEHHQPLSVAQQSRERPTVSTIHCEHSFNQAHTHTVLKPVYRCTR